MSIGDDIVQSAIVLQVSRVIVKFVPDLQLPQTEAAEAQHAAAHGAAWQTLQSKFPGVTLKAVLHDDRCRQARKHRTSGRCGLDFIATVGVI